MHTILISTYELGRQPFGLASPAAWLRSAGAEVLCVDLAIESLPEAAIGSAGLVAFYLPMHTATRLAAEHIRRVRQLNPQAHLVAYGLYAPLNADFLYGLGIDTLIGGEFEEELTCVYRGITGQAETQNQESRNKNQEPRAKRQVVKQQRKETGGQMYRRDARVSPITPMYPIGSAPILGQSLDDPSTLSPQHSTIHLGRMSFVPPDRTGLPALTSYAQLRTSQGDRVVGYTEASRGCKHTCRHCPVVPIYGGIFRIVPRDVVLADIRQQVAAGAQHITFGDPDFFNGPGHAIPLVQALHAEFPQLSYDVTIKVQHLLKHSDLLPILRDTGCAFVTSAVESTDDSILARFAKNHTRADFVLAVERMRQVGLAFSPTFVTFTPWTTRQGYCDLLQTIADLNLIEHVAPVQYAIRLLIPAGSLLLELAEVRELVQPFDAQSLYYPWQHPDPEMDTLYQKVRRIAQRNMPRQEIFATIWQLAHESPAPQKLFNLANKPIPHLSEPWYC